MGRAFCDKAWEANMISNIRPQGILAGLIVASAVALFAPAPLAAQGSSASKPSLDYEFFKPQVQPIFLKKRFPDHARCYVCHESSHHNGRDFLLERLGGGGGFLDGEDARVKFSG